MQRVALATILLAVSIPVSGADKETPFSAADLEFFEKNVRPVLVEHCYECHSAKGDEIEGGLRLDYREGHLKGGDTGAAIVPGKPEASRLVKAVSYADVDLQMPPEGKLPAAKIAALTEWVKRGAPWPQEAVVRTGDAPTFDLAKRKAEHWCWQPIRNPKLPETKNPFWTTQPLDSFVLAKLEEAGIDPAKTADRRTLIRRAHLDLTGLPPSPEEVEAFVSDRSEQAFEKVVDGLLASPHFGERWARHWMDLVRYAESHGHEFDYPIHHAWKYRDYLIRALNADVPYDQFIREHVAGDLIAKPRRNPAEGFNESVIGTGFWWLGEATHAPVDVRGDEAGRIDNQIDVMTKSFLGLTVACARCHDHKFDAISTNDYYALSGFLQSSRKELALLDRQGTIAESVAVIAKLRTEAEAILAKSIQTSLSAEEFSKYLLAAREVIYGQPKKGEAAGREQAAVLFEDFEKDSYEGWTVEGTAFGTSPQRRETTPGYQGDIQANGDRWVNSHNARGGKTDVKGGDDHLGRMTSREFKIQHRHITFLVGGGAHKDRTCVNLKIDGKVVRTQTGFSSNQMRPAEFDVEEFLGRTGQIEIVDQQKGGWGNIGVDHIVFQDGPKKSKRSVEAVAKEMDLNAKQLARWVAALTSEESKQPSHPMYLWTHLAPSAVDGKVVAAQRERVQREQDRSAKLDETHPVIGDFEDDLAGWFTDGDAFDSAPTTATSWDWQADGAALAKPGLARSNGSARKLHGVLRSPTFTLDHRAIFLRMRGEGVKVRLILDGYYMYEFNGLLFRGFQADVKDGSKFQWYQLGGDVGRYLGHTAYIEIIDRGDGWAEVDEVRLSSTGAPPVLAHPLAETLLKTDSLSSREDLATAYGAAWQTDEGRTALASWLSSNELTRPSTGDEKKLAGLLGQVKKLADAMPAPDPVLALTEGTSEDEHVFIRGSHKTPGELAPRHLLSAIDEAQPPITSGSGRLELAGRIASAKNPLTTRVVTNRVWHHLFGRGIVGSTDNFGVLGQRPTHPELLDHLATQFVKDGWSIKKLIKYVMLSSTYRMSSAPVVAAEETDPENLLLHRQNIRRLQGEVIRDAILTVSGRIDRKQFGPSVPVFLTSFMNGRGRPGSGPLDGAGRRSVYVSVRRNFLSPMMLAFDMPIPFNPVGRRNVSNVPSQALILMNDPFVIEQSKVWARSLVKDKAASVEDRVLSMYLTAFSKPPTQSQTDFALEFLEQQAREYGTSPNGLMTDERTWADFAHVLINTKPFIYLY
jgi:hypothetical protein